MCLFDERGICSKVYRVFWVKSRGLFYCRISYTALWHIRSVVSELWTFVIDFHGLRVSYDTLCALTMCPIFSGPHLRFCITLVVVLRLRFLWLDVLLFSFSVCAGARAPFLILITALLRPSSTRDRRGRMVVGFTTTCVICAYHH